MKIVLITPAPPGSRYGNRNTAMRWAELLGELGHRVQIMTVWDGQPADAMLALHARRSADSIARYAAVYSNRLLVVALTGTDLYRDIHEDATAQRSLALGRKLVVLQDMAVHELPPPYRRKACVVYQSTPARHRYPPLVRCFEICVSGHLREEKDPFRAAAALALLPPASRIRLTHIGGAMDLAMEKQARAWMARQPRYRWLGEVPRFKAARILGRSRAMVISSRMEGGANVVSEAIQSGVPVIASEIPGNIGMLGRNYPGYYRVEDESALAGLMDRIERDTAFLSRLQVACIARRPLISRAAERQALQRLFEQ